MRTADVVVIGGGCVGTSALYHLAARGCTDAVLLEGASLGSGSTSKAAGAIRLQHENEVNTRLVLASLPEFTAFQELTGVEIDFHQDGYLFLLDTAELLDAFSRAATFQRSLGAPTEVLAVDAIDSVMPGLHVDDLAGATFCPLEGYATPEAVVQGYASAARRMGATVSVDTPVIDVLVDGEGVAGVRTRSEVISTRRVVIAAGVGSRALMRMVGVDLPVHAQSRTIFYSGESAGVPDGAPLVVDFATSFYFHREGQGLLFAGRENDIADLLEPATHRLPALLDVSVHSSWSGDYDMSPDHNAMIGESPVAGLFYATGFSGHGFMQSPAVGDHLADLVLGRTPDLDLRQFDLDRFARGETRPERFVI